MGVNLRYLFRIILCIRITSFLCSFCKQDSARKRNINNDDLLLARLIIRLMLNLRTFRDRTVHRQRKTALVPE